MTRIYNLFLLFILLSVFSCKNSTDILPGSSGKAGELVIVMNKDKWDTGPGMCLKSIFRKEQVALPQSEPLFNVVNIPHSSLSDIFKTHRNILVTKISSEYKKPELRVKQDHWAENQLYMQITAPDDSSFVRIVRENKNKVKNYFLDIERQRLIVNYKKFEEHSITGKLKSNHNVYILFPKGFKLDVDIPGFVWLSRETPDISQGVLIYYYDQTDTNSLSRDNLVHTRDSILKKNVPGPSPDSYMTTEVEYDYPHYSEIYINDVYTAEIRGLWRVEPRTVGMGGPFVSFSRLDKKRNRVVTVEGYVYAPKYDKRNYLRQLEAILFTMKIAD